MFCVCWTWNTNLLMKFKNVLVKITLGPAFWKFCNWSQLPIINYTSLILFLCKNWHVAAKTALYGAERILEYICKTWSRFNGALVQILIKHFEILWKKLPFSHFVCLSINADSIDIVKKYPIKIVIVTLIRIIFNIVCRLLM